MGRRMKRSGEEDVEEWGGCVCGEEEKCEKVVLKP